MSHLMNTVESIDIEFVDTSGNCLVTTGTKHKKAILDWFMDNGTTPWGYDSIPILGCVSPHVPNAIFNQRKEKVTEKLCKRTHTDKAFHSMSGSEAVECAIKIARKYNHDVNGSRKVIYCYQGGFHGRTLAALAASSTSAKYHKEGFDPLPSGFLTFKSPHEIDWGNCIAVLLETVFGNNDVRVHPIEFIVGLANSCQEHYVPLILDEIQCGYCRTGRFNAFDSYGIKPGILCLGKGIAAGVPAGVTLARGEIADVLTPGTHFSTFGGNPHSIIGIDYMLKNSGEALLKVSKISNSICSKLRQFKGVSEVRAIGTMIAIDCLDGKAKAVSKQALKYGLFIPTFRDNIIKLSPPFSTTNKEIEFGLEALRKSFGDIYGV